MVRKKARGVLEDTSGLTLVRRWGQEDAEVQQVSF
jgi:hypothetical protein